MYVKDLSKACSETLRACGFLDYVRNFHYIFFWVKVHIDALKRLCFPLTFLKIFFFFKIDEYNGSRFNIYIPSYFQVCDQRPDILEYPVESFIQVRDILGLEFGLSRKKLFKVAAVLPNVFYEKGQQDLLRESFSSWFAFCKLAKLSEVNVLVEIPTVLLSDHDKFDERIDDLLEYFTSRNEVYTLVSNVPYLLLEPWSKVKAKLKFLIREMKVYPKTLAKTKAMAYDLIHIKVSLKL